MYFVKYFPNCCDFLISRHGFSKFPIFISTSHNLRNISFCRNFLKVKPRNLSNSLKYFSGLNLKSNDKSNHISSGKCDFTSCYSTTAHNSDKLTHTPNSLAPESDKIEVSDSSKPPFIVFDSMALTFDLDHAIAYTNRVLDDPISDISVSETSKFLIPFPNSDMPRVLEVLTKPFRESYTYEPATTMIQLCVERLENDRLTETFDIGDGFNKRAYFLTLHLWLLYRRALKEAPEGILLKNYLLEICYNVFRDWLFVRKVPEYMFNREFQNTQNHMLKFLLELNKSSEDEDLYPFRLSETIRSLMYENLVSDHTLELLVKYVLRQFMHVSNIDRRHFMNAMFLWADVEPICKPARLLKRPMYQLIKYGGYRGAEVKKIEPQDTKKLS